MREQGWRVDEINWLSTRLPGDGHLVIASDVDAEQFCGVVQKAKFPFRIALIVRVDSLQFVHD